MARVSEAFLQQQQQMKETKLRNPLIFVVDMIEGFVHSGALHDKRIGDITPNIRDYIERLQCRTIFVADAHPPKTREFLSYPTHCVIGSAESEVIEELQPCVQELFHKNSTNAFFCPDFQQFLQERMDQYQDILVMGCCSDICILQFTLSLQAWMNEHNKEEQQVIVAMDAIDTYHIEGVHDAFYWNEASISNMLGNGIRVVSTMTRG